MSPEKKSQKPIFADLPLAIDVMRAASGNQHLEDSLYDTLYPRIEGYILFRQGINNADDLTQETLIRLYEYLPKFDPAKGKGSFAENFMAWTYKIAESRIKDAEREALRKNQSEKVESLDENLDHGQNVNPIEPIVEVDEYYLNDSIVMNVIQESFPDLLSETEYKVLELKAQGEKLEDIARALGLKIWYVKSVAMHIRNKVDKNILNPAGFTRIKTGLSNAAQKGSLRSIRIFGGFYTRPEEIERYKGYLSLHRRRRRNSQEEQTVFESNPDSAGQS